MALLAASLSFAQSGLMGGSDGIHQINAKSLGQWNLVAGTGGNISIDPWALSRGGVFYTDGVEEHLQDFKVSATGNFFVGLGLGDFIDVGVGIPINYDRSYADDYLDATTNIKFGDLDVWTKIRAPFLSDSNVISLAAQFDLYFPTGAMHMGLRPRHAWYIKDHGDYNPYSASELVIEAQGIFTADFTKRNVPFRFNANLGLVYADEGTNTMVYGTGINWVIADYFVPFVEYSGEFRVEKNSYPRDPLEDPMTITPGIRIKLPYNIEIAGGLDFSVRALRNIGRDKDKEMKNVDKYTLTFKDDDGYTRTYGYVPTNTYAFTGLLTWSFGFAPKAVEPVCPQGLPQPDTVVKADTLFVSDTVLNQIVLTDTIRDADSDGVIDSLDACPNTPMGFPVDSLGCPVDEDHDGVTDSLDKCPGTPAGIFVGRDGCELDFDQDGVPDRLDMCPNTAPGIGVDSTGCAKDEDRDGVADDNDKCPATPKGATVDTTGCPLDTDKDGVPDYMDKCPNNLHGIKVDKVGCPVNKKEDLENLKKGINFQSGSTVLTKASYKTLDDIVALLTKVADVSLEIQGHTDNVGDPEMNKNLSQGRAQSVVDYMIRKGISVSRLRAIGFGDEKPIADNKTKKGKAKNRRVELVPFYPDEQ